MSSKRVLVTGGAGFIGSHLCEALLEDGWRVVALDSFDPFYPRKFKERNICHLQAHERFSLIEADIRDTAGLDDAFNRAVPAVVVHLAARAGVRPSLENPALYEENNVRGTLNMLEAAKAHGARRFLFASSSSVYGITDSVPFREDNTNLRVVSPYGATKVAGEALCHVYHRLAGFSSTLCLRFFTVYGPRQRPDMAIRKFTELITAGEELPLYGDGNTYRDYTYVTDIIQGMRRAVDRDLGFQIINLGESRTVKLADLIGMLEAALGMKARLRRRPPQPGDVPRTFACVDKARRLLDYDPHVGIEEGLETFVRWFNEQ